MRSKTRQNKKEMHPEMDGNIKDFLGSMSILWTKKGGIVFQLFLSKVLT